MNSNEVTILASAIGVGGTILGTILGWMLNSLSNIGKIYFSDIEIKKRYMGLKENMITGYIDDKSKATSYLLDVSLSAYNSSRDTASFKNIKLAFYHDNKLVKSIIPSDDNTLRKSGAILIADKAGIYNIHPKTLVNLKFSCAFHVAITDIINADRINLTYQNIKGKNKKIKLV